MIGKILEEKFSNLDKVYSLIVEDKSFIEEVKNLDKGESTSLYRQLELLLRHPRFGFFLSPANWIKARSEYLHEKIQQQIDSIKKMSNEELKKIGLTKSSTEEQINHVAEMMTIKEINRKIEDRKKQLASEGKSPLEISRIINREMPLYTNVMDINTMIVESTGDIKRIFMGHKLPNDLLSVSELEAEGKTPNYCGMSLENMRSIIKWPSVGPVWHDVNTDRLVVFGSGQALTKRQKEIKQKLEARIKQYESRISELEQSSDVTARSSIIDLQGRLADTKSELAKKSFGVWSPMDLNELIYGSDNLFKDGSPDVKKLTKESDILTSQKRESTGLYPQLYWKFAAPYDVSGSYWADEYKKIDKKVSRKLISEEEAIEERKSIEKLRQQWIDNNGDLRNISTVLYEKVVQFVVDHISTWKGRKKWQLETERNPSIRAKLREDIKLLDEFDLEPNADGHISYSVGSHKFVKNTTSKNPQWRKKEYTERGKETIYNVDVLDRYNCTSILKRLAVAQMLAQSIDVSIRSWVLGKVSKTILSECGVNTALIGVGSDPAIVNDFINKIHHTEKVHGVDGKISWLLIPHIEKHKEEANRLFESVGELYENIKSEYQIGNLKFMEYCGKRSIGTGVLSIRDKIERDKFGNVIKLSEEDTSYYIQKAQLLLQDSGEIDIDMFGLLSQEIDDLSEEIDKIDEQIKEVSDELEEMRGKTDSKSKTDVDKLIATFEEYKRRREELKSEVDKIDNKMTEMAGKIYAKAQELRGLKTEDLENIVAKEPIDTDAFNRWIEIIAKNGDKDAINYVNLQKEFTSQPKIETREKLYNAAKTLTNRYREELQKRDQTEKQKIAKIDEVIKLYGNMSDEELAKMVGDDVDAQYIKQRREAIQLESKIDDVIDAVLEANRGLNDEQIAKLATESLGHKDIMIIPERVAVFRNNKIKNYKNRTNILGMIISTFKKIVSERAQETGEDWSTIAQTLLHEGSTSNLVLAAVEAITAMIESSILSSSYTSIINKSSTNVSYVDHFGTLHLPPGSDLHQITYGEDLNPYNVVRSMRRMMLSLQKEIDSNAYTVDQKREKLAEIEKLRLKIDEYNKKLMKSPIVRKIAENGQLISSWRNPFHHSNGEYANELIDKMVRHSNGEDVEWGNRKIKIEDEEIEVNDVDLLEFLHRSLPTLETMGMHTHFAGNRYLCQIGRSVEVSGVTGKPTTTTKSFTELATLARDNFIDSLSNMADANKYVNALMTSFKELDIDKKLKEVGVPNRSIKLLAVEIACYANGALMKGTMTEYGKRQTRDFIKHLLNDFFISNQCPEVIRVIDTVVNRINDLAKPTKEEMEVSKKTFNDTMPLFNQIANGAVSLDDPDLPLVRSNIEAVLDLIQAIKLMQSGEKAAIDVERKIRDFIDFSDSLEIRKKSEEIYADLMDELRNIDALDNLTYLLSRLKLLDGHSQTSIFKSELTEITTNINKIIKELDDNHIKFDNRKLYSDDGVIYLETINSMLKTISLYRNSVVDKIEIIITNYSNDIPDLVGNVKSFKAIIDNSGVYQRCRAKLDHAAKYGIKLDDMDKLHDEMDKSLKIIKQNTKSIGIREGSFQVTHRLVMSKDLESMSEKYRNRAVIYRNIIKARNNILRGATTDQEKKEVFINIYNTLITMTKQYNMGVKDVVDELSDQWSQFEEAGRFVRREKRAKEIAAGRIKYDAFVTIPGIDDVEIEAMIFVRPQFEDILAKLAKSGIIKAKVYDPLKLTVTGGKSAAVINNEQISIVIDQSDLSGEQKFIDYMSTSLPKEVGLRIIGRSDLFETV